MTDTENMKREGIILEGVLLTLDEPTKNTGTIYPKAIIEKALTQYQALIDENRAFGELGTPDQIMISLERVSHRIRAASIDGNKVMVKVEILDTPAGKALKTYDPENLCFGIRALGKVSKGGIVEEPFELGAIDVRKVE